MNYSVVSYTPAVDKKSVGKAVIQVNGCALQTSIDTPYAMVQGSSSWNTLIDPIVNGILDAMNPDSASYDASLIGE